MNFSQGLRGQIIQSLGLMTFGIIFLSVFGSYAFYAVAMTYLPESISETWIPSRVEMIWIVCTIIAAFCMALFVAIRLSRRILTPLNTVANSLREIAEGKLDARASMDSNAMGETAQLVRDFNAMAEQLQNMTRDREFWNAAIAHELRTPVTILRGRLQGLAEGVFSPSNEIYEGLLRQVDGLKHIIEDLRVLSLNDSGHLELQWSEVCLANELRAVIDTFSAELEAKGFSIKLDLDTTRLVHCDVMRIRQALMALLDNALRHATPGNLTVRYYCSGNLCYISVQDVGPGIPEDAANYIFEAFRRIDLSRSRKSGGSGLGLAVVKAIAEAHRGLVVCRTSGIEGSIFELSWPVSMTS